MEEKRTYNRKQQPAPVNHMGKIPPQATDFEIAILGALLLEKNAIYDVVEMVKPEMFYVEPHKLIYSAIVTLYRQKKPIDILTVTQQLRTDGMLEIVGGGYVVTSLTARVSSGANMEYWCRIVMEKYLAREMIRSSTEIIQAAYEDTSDPFELLGNMGSFLSEAETGFITSNESGLDEIGLQVMQARENAPVNSDNISGYLSGIYELDKLIDGFIPGELDIIAARPAMGKTAVICSIAAFMNLTSKHPLVIFSLEMSKTQIFYRLETNISGLPAKNIKTNSLTEEEKWSLAEIDYKIMNGSMKIDDSSYLNSNQLVSRIKMYIRKYGTQIVILDYLQLLSSIGIKGGNRESEIAHMSRSLKTCAKEMNICIIALSQLSREVEKRRPFCFPSLGDLRESGAIEQDADKVIFLWRPEYYLTEEMQNDDKLKIGNTTNFRLFGKNIPNKNLLVFIVAKHREGELGNVPALFTPWNMRVTNHPALTESPFVPSEPAKPKPQQAVQLTITPNDEPTPF